MIDNKELHRRLLIQGKHYFSLVAVPSYRAFARVWNGSRTVGAVCVVLSPSHRVLLVKTSYQSGWGLPGGFTSRREHPIETAEREVFEETGISVRVNPNSGRTELDRLRRHINFVYVASVDTEALPAIGRIRRLEIIERKWFEYGELFGNLRPGTADLLATAGFFHQPLPEALTPTPRRPVHRRTRKISKLLRMNKRARR
jgi:ADP-ribose pyrophosphatase YjhB (NUDIX family)